MKRPLGTLQCPLCPSKNNMILKTRKYNYIPNGKNYRLEGDWWIYECMDCKETFTTTESDTISQENLKKIKL